MMYQRPFETPTYFPRCAGSATFGLDDRATRKNTPT